MNQTDMIRYDMIRWGLATDWVGCAKPVNVNTMECYLRATLVQGEKRSFNHAVGRERKQPSGYSWTGGREGIKKRSPDFQLIKLSRARGLMKAPLLELARNRSRANICPLFAICTGQKFRTLSQRYNKFLSAGFFFCIFDCCHLSRALWKHQ